MAKNKKQVLIQRISGPTLTPSQIPGALPILTNTETVAARIEDNKSNFDTHNGYNSINGSYTVPVSGVYQVSSIYMDKSGNMHMNTEIVHKTAGDCIVTFPVEPFSEGDYVFVHSNSSLGIYQNSEIHIIESMYPMIIGAQIDPRDHRTQKVPRGSKLASVLVLYGKKDKE